MSEEQTNPVAERIEERKRNAVDPETFLKDAGAIKTTGDQQKLGFTEEFGATLEEHVARVQDEGVRKPDLARLFGVPEEEVTKKDRPYTAWRIWRTVYNWPSEGALFFDVATDAAIREFSDDWDEVPPKQRFMIAQSLRSFQDECVFCSGEIVFNNNPVESCCSERRVLTLHCDSCERRFLEFKTEESETKSVGVRS